MADCVETTGMSIDVYTGVSYDQENGQGKAGSKIITSGSPIGDIPSITIRKVRGPITDGKNTTNQRLEVAVAREALEFIDAQSKSDGADYEIPLVIHAPSYVIDPFNKNWIEDKWRLSWSIKNADEWKELWTLEHRLSNKGFRISWKPRPKPLSKEDDPLDDWKRESSDEEEKRQFAEVQFAKALSVVSSSKSDSGKSAGTADPDYFMSFESLVGTGQNQNGEDGNVKKTDAEKTYEDVLSSSIVRALQDKTQMISLDSSAQTRTRLTHSIEVSSIALRLAQAVKATLESWQKDPDKDDSKRKLLDTYFPTEGRDDRAEAFESIGWALQTAGLLHDLGNPPFGHEGEDVLGAEIRNWLEAHPGALKKNEEDDLLNVEGNAQDLRYLLHPNEAMNSTLGRPSNDVISTMMKYTLSSSEFQYEKDMGEEPKRGEVWKHKAGFYLSELKEIEKIEESLSIKKYPFDRDDDGSPNTEKHRQSCVYARHPLAFLLEAADDIAYLTSDFEDAYTAGLIDETCLQAMWNKPPYEWRREAKGRGKAYADPEVDWWRKQVDKAGDTLGISSDDKSRFPNASLKAELETELETKNEAARKEPPEKRPEAVENPLISRFRSMSEDIKKKQNDATGTKSSRNSLNVIVTQSFISDRNETGNSSIREMLIDEAANEFCDKLNDIMQGKYTEELLATCAKTKVLCCALRLASQCFVYNSTDARETRDTGKKAVEYVFGKLLESIDCMQQKDCDCVIPDTLRNYLENTAENLNEEFSPAYQYIRTILDYMCSLTDRKVLELSDAYHERERIKDCYEGDSIRSL